MILVRVRALASYSIWRPSHAVADQSTRFLVPQKTLRADVKVYSTPTPLHDLRYSMLMW